MTDLKHFRPLTLIENWNEDRAKPLKGGVLADYGFREFTTDHRDAFPDRQAQWAAQKGPPGVAHRKAALAVKAQASGQSIYAMARGADGSWVDAAAERECGATARTFVSVVPHLPRGEAEEDLAAGGPNSAASWRTSTQDGYGVGDGPEVVAAETLRRKAPDAPWVRGRAGLRKELGRATSGVLGEVLKQEDNPQTNTASQRSWLYYKDPMLVVREGGAPSPRPLRVATLQGVGAAELRGETFDPEANNKRVAKITRYTDPKMHPQPGARVFADQDESVPLSW